MTPQQQALPKIAQAAVASEKITNCPADFQAAQCILESGWLQHAPGNNCFGIKSYPGCWGVQLLKTKEWFTDAELEHFLTVKGRTAEAVPTEPPDPRGRRLYAVQDWFATFPRLDACFARHAEMFTLGRYAPFLAAYRENRDLETFVRGIAPIYATAPDYASQVLTLIHQTNVQEAIAQARSNAI